MAGCAVKNRIVLVTLTLGLFSTLTILPGCKKKDQPEEAQQAVLPEKTKDISAPEKIVEADASEKFGLRILYAGLLDTDRAKDFVDFLSKHFGQVETTDYLTFTADKSVGFDVTILDHDGLDVRAPHPKISREYSHAVITMGVPGGRLSSRLNLKTGYL